jgi:hypothetical protein
MPVRVPVPPVPELARLGGNTPDEVVEELVRYYNRGSAVFNYRTATRATLVSYKGLHDLRLLTTGADKERTNVGKKSNSEVIQLAAPLAFGRRTQVFELPPRQFVFGRDLYSSYRIPFLFVEDSVVKVYFLQPSSGRRLLRRELGMIASIVKTYLVDTEFYGQSADIEVVDLGRPSGSPDRAITQDRFETIELWPEKQLEDRLSLIAEALDVVRRSERIMRRPRGMRRPEPGMPLFD